MVGTVTAAPKVEIFAAIQTAAHTAGEDFDYLVRTAMRESSLNPEAKARTSSATGLFQFIEQTWLATVKKHGEKHGLGLIADAIEVRADGRHFVPDKALRQEILALRKDPDVAARMAAELTADHRDYLEGRLGRPVTQGELYAAHFMGPKGAVDLIRAAQRDPSAAAADLFPEAARANRSIFYAADGTARSLSDVRARVTRLPDAPAVPDMPSLPETQMMLASAGYAPAVFSVETGDIRGSDAGGQPLGTLASFDGGAARPMLVLSPTVIEILASLDPVPGGSSVQDLVQRRAGAPIAA